MPALADSPTPRPDRTFHIAVAVLAAFAAAELLATVIHFGVKARSQQTAAAPRAAASATPAGSPASTPAASPASAAREDATPLSISDRLLREAQALNDRGDTANALARLQEAAQRDPRNAAALAQLATIYESIQLFDRSNDTWRRIEELGPPAGTYYELAEMKLKNGAGATPPPASSAPVSEQAIPEGSMFGITDVSKEAITDPDAETNFRLKISVRKRAGIPIELSKLKIVVRFYDRTENNEIVDTDADVGFEWFDPKHDWSDTDTETLIVSYVRRNDHAVTSEAAISAAAAAVTPGKPVRTKKRPSSNDADADAKRRTYYGYVVRISYDDKLQTVRADPPSLLNDAPAAGTP